VHALLLELTALLSFWLCIGAWQVEGAAAGRRAFIGLCLAVFTWSVGGLAWLEGLVTLEVAQRIATVGVIAVPTLWFGLGLLAAQHPLVRHRRWLCVAIVAPQLPLYATLYGDFAPGFLFSTEGGRTSLGPGGWANAVYSWLLAGLGSWLFLVGARRLRAQRGPRLGVCAASLAPLAGNVAAVFGLAGGVDPTPMLLGLSLLPLRSALFSGDWLHVLAIPEHEILSRIPHALVFTDAEGVVADLNPAAQTLLRTDPADAVGRSLEAVLAESALSGECTRWPIRVGEALAGYTVLVGESPRRAPAGSEA
jgi:PAS domain-containing protein